MYEIGRICLKIAGRDAGKYCVIVDTQDDRVLVDGQTRRRLVNTAHLEPLKMVAEVSQGASHEDVVAALAKHDIVVKQVVKQKDIINK